MVLFWCSAALLVLSLWRISLLRSAVKELEISLCQERTAHDKCRDQMLSRAIEEKAAAWRKDRREGDRKAGFGVMGVKYDDV